jgi:hypothetical protein
MMPKWSAVRAMRGAMNAATVQALIDNLVERGLDPAVPRLFIIDGAKARDVDQHLVHGPLAEPVLGNRRLRRNEARAVRL